MGLLGVGKRGGKVRPYMSPNAQLVAFQEAVREALRLEEKLPEGEYALGFYFWRQQQQYTSATTDRKIRKHRVDTTNLQKALEDALQGVLIDNDRNVRDVHSVIVEQGPDVTPAVVIRAEQWHGFDPAILPEKMWDIIDLNKLGEDQPTLFEIKDETNEWPEEDLF